MSQTIAALATPTGQGGIAIIRISGDDAFEIAQKVFKPKNKNKSLIDAKGYTAIFGHFVQEEKVRDEVVALIFRAPHSYTGENIVELSCHGGNAVSSALLRAIYQAGASPAAAGEFTKRAFLNGRISLTQAEAVMDIISASGQDGARAAAAAMQGALYKKIKTVQDKLLQLLGHVAAYTDYPEEDVPDLETNVLHGTLSDSLKILNELIDNYDKGAVLRSGVQTAIVGSPNVGKSTLLNLLAGYEKAIVTPIAGTTRDIVEQEVDIGGIRLLLADTAGLRDTEDVVEAEGIRRSKERMETASFIIAVFDGSKKCEEIDLELAKQCEGKRALALINKTDLQKQFDENLIKDYFIDIVSGSANTQDFADSVASAVKKVLGLNAFDADAAMLANERQFVAAKQAKQALQEALDAVIMGITLDAVGVCVEDAHTHLVSLTGEDATEDVINEVFSKFCVGK